MKGWEVDPKKLIPNVQGTFRLNYPEGGHAYFTKGECKTCGDPCYKHQAHKKGNYFCSGVCHDEYYEGIGENEIIRIPKIISHDIGGYLTFGRIIMGSNMVKTSNDFASELKYKMVNFKPRNTHITH